MTVMKFRHAAMNSWSVPCTMFSTVSGSWLKVSHSWSSYGFNRFAQSTMSSWRGSPGWAAAISAHGMGPAAVCGLMEKIRSRPLRATRSSAVGKLSSQRANVRTTSTERPRSCSAAMRRFASSPRTAMPRSIVRSASWATAVAIVSPKTALTAASNRVDKTVARVHIFFTNRSTPP